MISLRSLDFVVNCMTVLYFSYYFIVLYRISFFVFILCVFSTVCSVVYMYIPIIIINPWRACAARVTVVVLSFLPDSVRLSVTTFSAATRKKTANKRY